MTTESAPAVRTSELNRSVVRYIKMQLAARDWYQSDLAKALGEGEKWLSRRMRMELPLSLDEVDRIAAVLGVAAVDLFPRDGQVVSRVTTGYRDPSNRMDEFGTNGRPHTMDGSVTRMDPNRRPRHPERSCPPMPIMQTSAA